MPDFRSKFLSSDHWTQLWCAHYGGQRVGPLSICSGQLEVSVVITPKLGGLVATAQGLPLGGSGLFKSADDDEVQDDHGSLHNWEYEFWQALPMKVLKAQLFGRIDLPVASAKKQILTEHVLTVGDESLFDRYHRNKAKLVRRGLRQGVKITQGADAPSFEAACELILQVQKERRWATCYSREFLSGLCRFDEVEIFYGTVEGTLGAVLVCFDNADGSATAWLAALNRQSQHTQKSQVMNVLYHQMFLFYQNRGIKSINLGSSLGIESLIQFKEGFGCHTEPFYHYSLTKIS